MGGPHDILSDSQGAVLVGAKTSDVLRYPGPQKALAGFLNQEDESWARCMSLQGVFHRLLRRISPHR